MHIQFRLTRLKHTLENASHVVKRCSVGIELPLTLEDDLRRARHGRLTS